MRLIHRIIAIVIMVAAMASTANAMYRIKETYPSAPTPGTVLIICGGHVVYVIDADKALVSPDWHEAVVWSWDAHSAKEQLGLKESRIDHISDCKIVNNGQKALITSTYGWCAMVDCATGELLFHSTKTPNSHSADLLPDNLIAVANSDGTGEYNNSIQLYRADKSNELIAQYEFSRAHGVVWNDETQCLYVAGTRKIGVYRLEGIQTGSPSLVLECEVSAPRSDIHDIARVNQGKITVAGKEPYIYDLSQKSFRNIPALKDRTSLKSMNMNPDTGEMWYTDMTDTADIRFWFTHDIRWLPGRYSSESPAVSINIPDINVYKIRVAKWGGNPDNINF
ncbi:MAG: hypothetical protein HDS89_05265 [Bacteroidales bacterium]|nr:hypothetical protein [Bacteroidales bacterium]